MTQVHSGGTVALQEFSSLELCNKARLAIYAEDRRDNVSFGLESAICLEK